MASVERVDPGRFDSHLWMGPQAGSEGTLLDVARSRGIKPRILPNLVREIHPWKDPWVTLELARRMRRERFDIVHTHSSKAGIVGRVAARLAGVPVIVHTVHGWGFHDHMAPVARRVYVGLEKALEPWTDSLVSVSKETTRIGLEAGIGRADAYRLIRSGIPRTRFTPDPEKRRATRAELGLDENAIVIGSVGRLSPQKNPGDFVGLAEGVSKRHRNARFLYVGDGSLRREVEAAARDAGVDDRVRWMGVRSDVPDLLRAMDVFVLTSLWEGLPRVIPQALASGVPVVAFSVSGIDEIILEGRNGHVVRPGDLPGLIAKVSRLVEDDSYRRSLALRATDEFDDAFTEDAMIRDLEDLYAELLERHESKSASPEKA